MKKSPKRLLLLLLAIALVWGAFACTRYSAFTTYVPFSGRIFAVEPAQADRMFVQNGTTGTQHFFESAEEKAEIARLLNELHYRFWLPALPIARGGWSWRVAIEAGGKQYSFTFGDGSMTVNGVVYILPDEQLDVLRQYAEE